MLRTSAELALEERVQRGPYTLSHWLSYTSHLSANPDGTGALFRVYERALAALPGSYKLWRAYSQAFRAFAAAHHPAHAARRAALDVSARAARALRVSPVLWADYVRHAAEEACWTEARLAANDALRALPVLQHDAVWDVLLEAVVGARGVPPRLSVLLLRRYAKLRPGIGCERLFRYLVKAEQWDEAVTELCAALADPAWVPGGDKTREQLWMELARLAAKHPKEMYSTDVPALLRGAITDARTDVGELWVVLGEYFIRKGLFEDARNVYEEAISSVSAVRDFAVIFDAYAKFEESLVSAAMEDVQVIQEEIKEVGGKESQSKDLKDATEMVELLIARLEFLTNRRPMLLSDVWLRQNPHNVHEWHKRARMFKQANDALNVVDTYTKAVQIVDPWRATNGRPHTLWLAFAKYYENAKDLVSARRVLDKAVSEPEGFRSAEDLAAIWCEYAEMELRFKTPEAARAILLRATTKPEKTAKEEAVKRRGKTDSNLEAVVRAGAGNTMVNHVYDNASPAWNSYKSMRVWHFLIDLSQSISQPSDVIDIHHQMFDLRIASVQTVLSGASYLESKRLFEQAFRLLDKGANAISWPEALKIWVVYLTKFVKRFGSRKLERARDLFEEAIRSAPSTRKGGRDYPHPQLRLLYIMYANMEEQHSLARHALKVLARAVKAVKDEDQPDMYRLYIVKMATLFGVTKTRPIFEEAMSSLTRPEDVLDFAVRYAAMETRVGEVDRARGIYNHSCQIADPRRRGVFEIFWKSWNEFELTHGSEDTFRDMLREKRNVQLNHKGVILDEDVLIGNGVEGGKRGIRNMVREKEDNNEKVNDTTEVTNAGAVIESAMAKASGEGTQSNGDTAGNAEEIEIDLSDDDSDAVKASEEEKGARDGVRDIAASRGDARKGDRKLKIVEKELPESIRRLVEASRTDDQKDGESDVQGHTSGGMENEDSRPANVQKALPDSMRKLVDAAHSDKLKRKRNESAEDVSGHQEAEKPNDGGKPLGALERFKRRK